MLSTPKICNFLKGLVREGMPQISICDFYIRFAVVYRGRWRGTEVAVKRILNVSKEKIAEILQESKLMEYEIYHYLSPLFDLFHSSQSSFRTLRHPFIITFLGTAIHSDSILIVTDYASRGSLRQVDIMTFSPYHLLTGPF